ncbi:MULTISPECIES: deoxynucleoside kinase [unclassified Dolichospermum]|uniref:deoxynucleoside kinase n=1 Tax=unclassified Dolichospermum TaxID=2622029 RepID=UPI0014473E7E|nr:MULTISPECIES: deoxynucleoside kinase [unclassified Dolichospermum]MTJ15849.1 hypothetical protein [Dolichospermum sp. UHCC 0299]MTJ41618.1 hypothetical protein [Dolichospermum sp. UHCC 0406]
MAFIVSFEGADASGKTTLSTLVTKELIALGYEVIYCEEFPDSYIDGYLNKLVLTSPYIDLNSSVKTPVSQTMVLAGLLTYKYEALIKPELHTDKIIVVDRYYFSFASYQGEILESHGINFPFEDILKLLVIPNLTIHVTCSKETRERRLKSRNIIVSDMESEFFESIDGRIAKLADSHSHTTLNNENSLKENMQILLRYILKNHCIVR